MIIVLPSKKQKNSVKIVDIKSMVKRIKTMTIPQKFMNILFGVFKTITKISAFLMKVVLVFN